MMKYEDIEEFRKNAIDRLKKESQYATANAVDEAFGALICIGQFKWERDIAIEQLNEIGCGLGENMDAIKKRLESRPRGEWIEGDLLFEGDLCSVCKTRIYNTNGMNFCPHCGADMRKKV